MSMKEITPVLWLLNVRAWKDGKDFRKREEFHGGKKAAGNRCYEIKKSLVEKAGSSAHSLKALSFAEALDFYLERKK